MADPWLQDQSGTGPQNPVQDTAPQKTEVSSYPDGQGHIIHVWSDNTTTVTADPSYNQGSGTQTYTGQPTYSSGTPPATTPPATTPPATTPPTPSGQTPPPPAAANPDAPPAGQYPDDYDYKYDANGNVVALVYKYTANGHNKGDVVQSFQGLIDKMNSIGAPPPADFSRIQDLTQTGAYGQLDALLQKLQDPNTTAQDYDASLGILARIAGVGTTSADWTSFMSGLNANLTAAKAGLTQETPEQQGQTAQYLYSQRTDTEALMRKQVDAIMSGNMNNSTNAAILKSNEFVRGLNNDQISAQVQLSNMHLSQNLNAFNAQLDQYKEMFNNGSMTAGQIVKSFQDNRLAAIQGYAVELQQIQNNNQNVFTENQQALDVWKANADNIYNEINAQLGIDKFAMDKVKNNWDSWYTKQQAAFQEQMNQNKKVGGWLEVLAGGLLVLGGFLFPPLAEFLIPGGIAVAGAGAGNVSGTY